MSCSLAKLPNESAAFIGYVHIAEAAVFGAAHADDEMLLAKQIERTARGGTANPQAFADQTRLGGTAELLKFEQKRQLAHGEKLVFHERRDGFLKLLKGHFGMDSTAKGRQVQDALRATLLLLHIYAGFHTACHAAAIPPEGRYWQMAYSESEHPARALLSSGIWVVNRRLALLCRNMVTALHPSHGTPSIVPDTLS